MTGQRQWSNVKKTGHSAKDEVTRQSQWSKATKRVGKYKWMGSQMKGESKTGVTRQKRGSKGNDGVSGQKEGSHGSRSGHLATDEVCKTRDLKR